MTGAVFLESNNVSLSTLEDEDLEKIRDISNRPEVWKNFIHRKPRNLSQIEKKFDQLQENDDAVVLAVSVDNKTIGYTALEKIDVGLGEIAIEIDPDEQGKGYGTEASRLLIDYGFEQLRFHKLFARTFSSNTGSQALWEKLGLEREAEIKESVYIDGEFEKSIVYGTTKEEWE